MPAREEKGSANRQVYSSMAWTLPTASFPAMAQRQPMAAQTTYPMSLTRVVMGLTEPAVTSAFRALSRRASFSARNSALACFWWLKAWTTC